jgi:L-lactate utilization protein LutB
MSYQQEIRSVLDVFAAKGFAVHYAQDRVAALEIVKTFITPEISAAYSGSASLKEIGAIDLLRNSKVKLLESAEGASVEERIRVRRQAMTVDLYLTGTNALTRDGKMVNIDGFGNRVAAQMFGPSQVVVVAGRNKIVGNLSEALYRVKFIAAPPNVRRLNTGAPCGESGVCSECSGPGRICNDIAVIENVRIAGRISLIIVDESLGY